jgi:hypothetical protein
MDKLFCPRCGNASLAKLGVTLRRDGQPDYHYAKGRRVNIRGSKFPLPTPKVHMLTQAHTRTRTGKQCREAGGGCVVRA